MITPLSLYPFLRDTWGSFDPLAIAQLAALSNDPCYQPKYYGIPDNNKEVIPANGNINYGLQITPGSLIWGVLHNQAVGNNDNPGFVFNLKDIDMDLMIWEGAIPDAFVAGTNLTGPGFFPWLLTSPYPVVGRGLFSVNIYNNSGAPLRCNLTLGVLEVVKCPY